MGSVDFFLVQLLLAYLSTPRSEGLEVDRTMADHDAKALYKAGEKRLGTDEKTFRVIFSGRSRAHMAAVSSAYHNMYGSSLKKVIYATCCHFIFLHFFLGGFNMPVLLVFLW